MSKTRFGGLGARILTETGERSSGMNVTLRRWCDVGENQIPGMESAVAASAKRRSHQGVRQQLPLQLGSRGQS
ncbi:hypothetical protein RHIZ404_190178 [Rhizobium sp. EC-SD404]|nr:hypothetical protein RHIZ404_190178 [Rhizobium sp. EC-SD404]